MNSVQGVQPRFSAGYILGPKSIETLKIARRYVDNNFDIKPRGGKRDYLQGEAQKQKAEKAERLALFALTGDVNTLGYKSGRIACTDTMHLVFTDTGKPDYTAYKIGELKRIISQPKVDLEDGTRIADLLERIASDRSGFTTLA